MPQPVLLHDGTVLKINKKNPHAPTKINVNTRGSVKSNGTKETLLGAPEATGYFLMYLCKAGLMKSVPSAEKRKVHERTSQV